MHFTVESVDAFDFHFFLFLFHAKRFEWPQGILHRFAWNWKRKDIDCLAVEMHCKCIFYFLFLKTASDIRVSSESQKINQFSLLFFFFFRIIMKIGLFFEINVTFFFESIHLFSFSNGEWHCYVYPRTFEKCVNLCFLGK